jgi:hypothetical protein
MLVFLTRELVTQNASFFSYPGAAKVVLETFTDIVETKFQAVASLGVALTAHEIDHSSQQWPYVTLSSFQQRVATTRKQSGALWVHLNPIVRTDQREDWENFASGESSVWM